MLARPRTTTRTEPPSRYHWCDRLAAIAIPTEFLQAAGLDPSAIDENRAGRLTPSQGQTLLDQQRGIDSRYMAMAAMMSVVAAIGAFRGLRGLPPPIQLLGAVGLVGGVVLIVVIARSKSAKLKDDVSDGKVLSIDGPAERRMFRGRQKTSYHLKIGDEFLEINGGGYHAFDTTRRYRAYYLPRTSKLVNLEILS